MKSAFIIGAFCFAAIALIGFQRSDWNLFPPKDYEECTENAALHAKSKDALTLLISSCQSKFAGRRNARGGYFYHDSRQASDFAIAGPNPSPQEWRSIDGAYSKYLDEKQKSEEAFQRWNAAELDREETERQRQNAIAAAQDQKRRQAQMEFERRRQSAIAKVGVVSNSIECTYPSLGCGDFKLTTTIKNQSSENVSMVFIGWVFTAKGETSCPSTLQPKSREQVRLRPGDSLVLNIDGHDGPRGDQFRYCVKVMDIQIEG
jgi:hypothetical protein